MPSQYGEEKFILNHFAGRIGRFLDVGAFDGVTFSNTRCLWEAGWEGTLVEPSPPAFCWLMKNYDGAAHVKLVNAALGGFSVGGLKKFHCNTTDAMSCDALSTFSEEHVMKFPKHPFREIYIPQVSWPDLIPNGEPCQFVNIDVEGYNYQAVATAPLHQFEMVCVEIDPSDLLTNMESKLYEAGLEQMRIIGGNLLAWRKNQYGNYIK